VSRLVRSRSQAERDRIGLLIVRFVMTSFARTGLLYGDPHPGNFLLQPDGRLGVVDFGACSAFPLAGLSEATADFYEAVFNGGVPELENAIRRHGFVTEGRDFDVEQLAECIPLIHEHWLSPDLQLTTSWLRSRVLRMAELRVFNVTRQFTAPPEAIPLVRTVVTLLGVLCQLEAEGSIRDEILSHLPQLAQAVERFKGRNRHARSAGVIDFPRTNNLTSPKSAEA
jgi:predicted unusual protein kinase regulating ubiquinone biosynthesis (AarF/ABC1/UbiB family)